MIIELVVKLVLNIFGDSFPSVVIKTIFLLRKNSHMQMIFF